MVPAMIGYSNNYSSDYAESSVSFYNIINIGHLLTVSK